jgi:NADPH:quinone reductase-like Zn-dependent oxidoreductase
LSLRQCGIMLKQGGVSLHIVPNFAKWAGSLFSSRHHLVFGNPTPESFAGIAQAAEHGILVPVIGRSVPLSEAISAIAELEKTGSPKGRLVIVPG